MEPKALVERLVYFALRVAAKLSGGSRPVACADDTFEFLSAFADYLDYYNSRQQAWPAAFEANGVVHRVPPAGIRRLIQILLTAAQAEPPNEPDQSGLREAIQFVLGDRGDLETRARTARRRVLRSRVVDPRQLLLFPCLV